MTDQELNNVSATDTEVDGAQYIQALNELKQNTVSRDEYLKLKNENKQLLQSLVNGETLNQPTVEQKVSTEELRSNYEKLSLGDSSNLDYWKATLALRERDIEEGRLDPFLPHGHNYVVQQSDIDAANKVATIVQECIDYADGDSAVFTNELQRRTKDVNIPRKR